MSSGFPYPQPTFQSSIYNPAFYLSLDSSGYLTYAYAQTLYLGKDDYRLSYLSGISIGVATQGAALVIGTDGGLSGIGALSCASLTVDGAAITSSPAYITGINPGTAQVSKALVLDSTGSIAGIKSMTFDVSGTGLDIPSLKFSGTTFNQPYYIGITEGGATGGKAVVLNSTKDFNRIRNLICSGTITASTSLESLTLTCDTISKAVTQIMNATTLINLNPTTLQLRGTTITASAAEINYLSTISPGTVGNSKDMVVDSLGSIAGLNSLNCVSISTSGNITAGGVINGFLGYANQAGITTVGPLTELGINSTAISEYIRVQASGLDYLDGSYTRMVRFLGSNLTPVGFQIEVNNGARATTTNAAWIGTRTANDLRFGTNDSAIMIISAAGRVGIGTTTPSYQLHVSGSVSSSIDAGGSGVAYFLRSGGLVSTIGPLSSISVGIGTSGAVLATSGFYTTSDSRIMKDFTELSDSVADALLTVNPLLFRYKNQNDSTPLQLGYRAQDLLRAGLPHCVNFIDVDDLPVDDETVDTLNIQYSVDYSKVVCLLHKLVLRQQSDIVELKNRLTIIE